MVHVVTDGFVIGGEDIEGELFNNILTVRFGQEDSLLDAAMTLNVTTLVTEALNGVVPQVHGAFCAYPAPPPKVSYDYPTIPPPPAPGWYWHPVAGPPYRDEVATRRSVSMKSRSTGYTQPQGGFSYVVPR